MYATLITNIKSILDTLTGVGQKLSVVYDHPLNKGDTISGYPAVVFYPVAHENAFMSNEENFKEYRFKVFVLVECEVASIENVFKTILAEAVDDVVQKFDDEWNGGVISGHRVWYRMTSGDWYLDQEESGLVATAELNLLIKLATSNA